MPTQRCAAGTEAASDALRAIINKALQFPRVGTHVGGGIHVTMPASWDGQGATPPGWTKHVASEYVVNASTAWVAIPDDTAALLSAPEAAGRLTGPELAALVQAINERANVDPEAQGGSPKANAVADKVTGRG